MYFLDLPSEIHNHIFNLITDDIKTDPFRIINNCSLVSKYLNTICLNNIKSRKLIPKPIFNKGCLVKYKKQWLDNNIDFVNQLKREYNEDITKETTKFIIISKPLWDPFNKDYLYRFDFYFRDEVESMAHERDLEPVKNIEKIF